MRNPIAKSLQCQVNERGLIPRDAWRATVAIVLAKTAAHVIRVAHEDDRTIGISGDSNSLIAVHGEWIASAPSSGEDPVDVAVYSLPERAVQRLQQSRFFRISDVSFSEQPQTTGILREMGGYAISPLLGAPFLADFARSGICL